MKREGFLPCLSDVFSLQFLGANAPMAYTVSGAFIEYLLRARASRWRQKWYGGATFEQSFGASLDSIERLWWQDLASIELSQDALKFVDSRYHQASVWGRTCPHVVERLRDQASECDARGDRIGAIDSLDRLLALDTHDSSARYLRARLLEKTTSKEAERLALLDLASDEKAGMLVRAHAFERIGDLYLSMSSGALAIASYADAAQLVLDEDRLRTLDVKSWVAGDAARMQHFGGYFSGESKLIASILALGDAAHSGSIDEQSFARYLLARRLVDEKQWLLARAQLQLADATALSHISIRLPREAARLSMLVACYAPDNERKTQLLEARTRMESSSPTNAQRRWGDEMFERCSTATTNGVITMTR